MAKITSVKTSADNNKLFTAQVNDDNSREFKEYDITSGINNKTLQETADVTSFDEGMDVITVNPTGDKFVGVDRRGRDVINLSTTNNFSVNSFNLLSSFKVDRLVRGDVFLNKDIGVDVNFMPEPSGSINVIKKIGDFFYIGGNFGNIGGNINYAGIARFNLDGSLDTTFPTMVLNDYVNDILEYNGYIYVAGKFNRINGSTNMSRGLYRMDLNGVLDNSFNANVVGEVITIDVFNDELYVGGIYSNAFGANRTNLCRHNLTNGSTTTMNTAGGGVYKVKTIGDYIYISGDFIIGSFTRLMRRDVNNNIDFSFTPNFSSLILTIEQVMDKIYFGGGFNTVNGDNTMKEIAIMDINTSIFSSTGLSVNSTVRDIKFYNGFIYIVGAFTNINGNSTFRRLIRIDTNNNLDTQFSFNIDGVLITCEIVNGILYIGGAHNSIDLNNQLQRLSRVELGDNQFIITTEIPFETMGVTSDRLVKLNTSNTITTATNDFNNITISDGTNEVTILPSQINTQINANVLIGRSLTVTYDLTGNKDINTVLSEYNLTINK